MNLIVDIGNSLTKLAVFQHDELVEINKVENSGLTEKAAEYLQKFSEIDKVVVSNVSNATLSFPENINPDLRILEISATTPLPFKNLYATPQTLGNDRKALVAAAVKYYSGENVLVIDAGTCITYDFKNKADQYLGGAISPGLRMRFLALNHFTANLPLVEMSGEYSMIGNSTSSSIISGVQHGTIMEVQGVIDSYSKIYEEIRVIITGGDATFLSINLKNGIFANSNFLLEGLNFILEYNIDK